MVDLHLVVLSWCGCTVSICSMIHGFDDLKLRSPPCYPPIEQRTFDALQTSMVPLSFFYISFGGGRGVSSNLLALTVPVARIPCVQRSSSNGSDVKKLSKYTS